jgi:hypothetical protein
MSKKTKRIQNKDDYEDSSFKDIMEDVEDTKEKKRKSIVSSKISKFADGFIIPDDMGDKALESVPKIRKEQVPSDEETSNEILHSDDK